MRFVSDRLRLLRLIVRFGVVFLFSFGCVLVCFSWVINCVGLIVFKSCIVGVLSDSCSVLCNVMVF